jgi:hypothetical protein
MSAKEKREPALAKSTLVSGQRVQILVGLVETRARLSRVSGVSATVGVNGD